LACVLLLALVQLVSANVPVPYTSCATGPEHVTLTSVSASAWPTVKGSNLVVDLAGNIDEILTGGTYEVKVSFDYIPVIDKTGNLADLNVTFPLPVGPISLQDTFSLPSGLPSGHIDVTITAADSHGSQLLCVAVSSDISPPPKRSANDVPIPYQSCGSSSDQAQIKSLTINTWPPTKSAPITIHADVNLSEQVTGGKYEAKVSFDGIPIADQSGNLADLGVTFPLSAGDFTLAKTFNLPSIIPSGNISITASATDQNGNELTCLGFSFILQ